jgi:transcriptional regulator with XRE-family HTH domain
MTPRKTRPKLPEDVEEAIGTLAAAMLGLAQGDDPAPLSEEAADAFNATLIAATKHGARNRPVISGFDKPSLAEFGDIVGARMKALRTESGWTQERFAQAMTECGWQWTRVTTAEVESNDRRLTMEELLTVAALFSVPAIELMVPGEKQSLELQQATLDTDEMRELLLGRGGQVGTGGLGWPSARKALGSPKHKVEGPAVDLWRARRNAERPTQN